MNVRITLSSKPADTVIRIVGKLHTEDIGELEREARGTAGALVLDVSELAFTDRAGAMFLNALVRGGAELRGVSPYLALLLEQLARQG
jgi:anti-anti-sigma regulatory factor